MATKEPSTPSVLSEFYESTGVPTLPYTNDHAFTTPPTTDTPSNLDDWNSWFYLLQVGWIVIMIVWPWVFVAILSTTPGGLAMHPKAAYLSLLYPEVSTFFVTTLSNALALVVSYLFSLSARTLATKWLASKPSNIYFLSLFSAAKSPAQAGLSWTFTSRRWLSNSHRLRHALALVFYGVLFFLILGGFTSLLNPRPITWTAPLSGSELDFTSTDPDCTFWFENNAISDDSCGWLRYRNSSFTTCLGENQMVDVLESGRSNILSSIPENDNAVTFNQLGGLRFFGPVRGVLPTGPLGVSVLDNLPFSSSLEKELEIAQYFGYTVDLQGLASTVTCSYETESPISVFTNKTSNLLQVNATCPPGQDILGNPTYPSFIQGSEYLGFYACNGSSREGAGTYHLYFRGYGNYKGSIGNASCLVSSAHHATYEVTYASASSLFLALPSSSPSPSNGSLILIDSAVRALGELVWNAQWLEFNSVAESIVTFAVKDFGLQEYASGDQNMRILEAMVQGVLEYEVTYARLIYELYNTGPDMANEGIIAPSSCLRHYNGSVDLEMIGWHVSGHNLLFLIPMTIVNITSLAMLLAAAFFVGQPKKLPNFDPSNPISVLIAASRGHLTIGPPHPDDPDDVWVSDIGIKYGEQHGVAVLTETGRAAGTDVTSTGYEKGHYQGSIGQRKGKIADSDDLTEVGRK
ncbi:hypothetical protein JAAARDRAFT_197483 [Jaapia argillacea MUCL 33604]|uniref:Uncharacterized protein n=1 Tax=Jaapia argillacea MUCL 33604 TaxID=933084 RepID=A0A067PEI1_9AGAM|nr:hypothetical protein JAAARDRAFT_197483 [Jaapia argillacea MUCL 33604]